jgi:hypothetical protein
MERLCVFDDGYFGVSLVVGLLPRNCGQPRVISY